MFNTYSEGISSVDSCNLGNIPSLCIFNFPITTTITGCHLQLAPFSQNIHSEILPWRDKNVAERMTMSVLHLDTTVWIITDDIVKD